MNKSTHELVIYLRCYSKVQYVIRRYDVIFLSNMDLIYRWKSMIRTMESAYQYQPMKKGERIDLQTGSSDQSTTPTTRTPRWIHFQHGSCGSFPTYAHSSNVPKVNLYSRSHRVDFFLLRVQSSGNRARKRFFQHISAQRTPCNAHLDSQPYLSINKSIVYAKW